MRRRDFIALRRRRGGPAAGGACPGSRPDAAVSVSSWATPKDDPQSRRDVAGVQRWHARARLESRVAISQPSCAGPRPIATASPFWRGSSVVSNSISIVGHITPVVQALQHETRTIPIVFVVVFRPGRKRIRGRAAASRRQHHRLCQSRSVDDREVDRAAAGGLATPWRGPPFCSIRTPLRRHTTFRLSRSRAITRHRARRHDVCGRSGRSSRKLRISGACRTVALW